MLFLCCTGMPVDTLETCHLEYRIWKKKENNAQLAKNIHKIDTSITA